MNRTTRWFSFLSSTVFLATIVGCGGSSLDRSKDAGSGGSGGSTQVGTGGTTSGSGGSSDARGEVSGIGGTHSDAAEATAGTAGTGDARGDAQASDHAREDARGDAGGSCTGSASATACVACCGALYPDAAGQAFFGNECLYCTATCRETTICRGVASAGLEEIDGPCLKCAQPYIVKSDCSATGGPKCEAFLECLKACPTN